MGVISVEQTDRLFWLGRYTERVYTTISLFSARVDRMIDGEPGGYVDFADIWKFQIFILQMKIFRRNMRLIQKIRILSSVI